VKYKNESERRLSSYFVCSSDPRLGEFYRQNNSRDICHLGERPNHGSNCHGQSKRSPLNKCGERERTYEEKQTETIGYIPHTNSLIACTGDEIQAGSFRDLSRSSVGVDQREESSLTSVDPLATGSEICALAHSGAQAIHSMTLSWPRSSPLHSPLGNDQIRIV
jgi:hypothetical protein